MSLLGEHSDWLVPFERNDDIVRASSLDSAGVGDFFELLGSGGGVGCVGNLVDPFWWGGPVKFLFSDPVSHRRFVASGG